MNSYTFRRTIELTTYLEMANDLNKAAKAVLNNRLSEKEAMQTYKIDAYYLKKKIKELSHFKLFTDERDNYTLSVINIESKIWTEYEALEQVNIDLHILLNELQEARRVGLDKYSFNRQLSCSKLSDWSYMDEESLLEDLRNWINSGQRAEITKLCALEQLSKFAYKYVKKYSKDYPRGWDTFKETDVYWLKRFHMRHHDEIEAIFDPIEIPASPDSPESPPVLN